MENLAVPRHLREKLYKEMKKIKVDKLKAKLPNLDMSGVRRARMPYGQAVYLDLQDGGFEATLDFLKQLVEYQEDLRRHYGPESEISMLPLLIENREQLDKVLSGLKVAEIAHRAGKYSVECEEILKLGIFYYKYPTHDWSWLTKELLVRCVKLSRDCGKLADQYEALSRYVLALFYLSQRQNVSDAKHNLLIVQRLSKGKTWNAGNVFNEKQDRIYTEVCKLLSEILIEEGKMIMFNDAFAGEELFNKAEKLSKAGCSKLRQAEAMKMKGICCLMKGEFHDAAITFYRVLLIQMAAKNPKKIFEARLNLALAYLK